MDEERKESMHAYQVPAGAAYGVAASSAASPPSPTSSRRQLSSQQQQQQRSSNHLVDPELQSVNAAPASIPVPTASTATTDDPEVAAPLTATQTDDGNTNANASAATPFPFTIPEADPSVTKEVLFTRPMLYYKRSTTGRRAPLSTSTSGPRDARVPTQVILPDRSMLLGFPPVKPEDLEQEMKEEADMSSNLLVFSGPTLDQRNRARVFSYLLTFLLVADFIVLLVLFASVGDLSVINLTDGSTDNLTFICTTLLLLLGYISMSLRETRVISLFIVLMFVDAMINLMRLYSVLQITHCVLQLAVCHVMIQYRASLQPTWFAPGSAS